MTQPIENVATVVDLIRSQWEQVVSIDLCLNGAATSLVALDFIKSNTFTPHTGDISNDMPKLPEFDSNSDTSSEFIGELNYLINTVKGMVPVLSNSPVQFYTLTLLTHAAYWEHLSTWTRIAPSKRHYDQESAYQLLKSVALDIKDNQGKEFADWNSYEFLDRCVAAIEHSIYLAQCACSSNLTMVFNVKFDPDAKVEEMDVPEMGYMFHHAAKLTVSLQSLYIKARKQADYLNKLSEAMDEFNPFFSKEDRDQSKRRVKHALDSVAKIEK